MSLMLWYHYKKNCPYIYGLNDEAVKELNEMKTGLIQRQPGRRVPNNDTHFLLALTVGRVRQNLVLLCDRWSDQVFYVLNGYCLVQYTGGMQKGGQPPHQTGTDATTVGAGVSSSCRASYFSINRPQHFLVIHSAQHVSIA